MKRARQLYPHGVWALIAGVVLVTALAFVDVAVAVIVAIMLIGLLVVIVPLVSMLFDERQSRRLRP
jgi:ABC-type transport system involved in cytochrome bd biosynthesis fused ATPase/permease subunit